MRYRPYANDGPNPTNGVSLDDGTNGERSSGGGDNAADFADDFAVGDEEVMDTRDEKVDDLGDEAVGDLRASFKNFDDEVDAFNDKPEIEDEDGGESVDRMGLQGLAAMVLPQVFKNPSDLVYHSNHDQEADEESHSDQSYTSEIPFRKSSLTEASDDSGSDLVGYEDDSSDSDDNESNVESSTDELHKETEEEHEDERVELVSSDLPACAACNKHHTECDRAEPCQACRSRGQQCMYPESIVVEKSTALNALAEQRRTGKSSTTTSERQTSIPTKDGSSSGRKSLANGDRYSNFATDLPLHVRSLLGEDSGSVVTIPEVLIQKLPNHAALQTGRPGHEAVWVNSAGRKLSVSRRQIGSRAWLTVAEHPDNPPCVLAKAWKMRQETYSCTAYTTWRGENSFDSEPSIYKIIPNRKIPIADLLRDIKAYQLCKWPDGFAAPSEQLAKKPRLEVPTPTIAADKEPDRSKNYFSADITTKLPAHLRTSLQTYIGKHPGEKPLDCAYANFNKLLNETKSGQKSSWVSKSGQRLSVDQYDLGDYGWIIVARGTGFPAQIIKYWPWNGYSSKTGRSPFFVWNGYWDESEGPKVFKTWQTNDSTKAVNRDPSRPLSAPGKRRLSEAAAAGPNKAREQSQTRKVVHPSRSQRDSVARARSSLPARVSTPSPARMASRPPFGSIRLATTVSPEVPISQLVRERPRVGEMVKPPDPQIEVRIPSPDPRSRSPTTLEEHGDPHRHQQISLRPGNSSKPVPVPQTYDPSVCPPGAPPSLNQTPPSSATILQPSAISSTSRPDPSTDNTPIRSLFHFSGSRPRTRPYSTCSSVQKLFLQATAAGLFESLADASMLLCRLGQETEARDFAVIKDAEDDFEELTSAILEIGGAQEVFVRALKLN
ncbi:MAG: hypothetical protein Q9160_008678 [Pyrenula sp. 1 TL-2023]